MSNYEGYNYEVILRDIDRRVSLIESKVNSIVRRVNSIDELDIGLLEELEGFNRDTLEFYFWDHKL